MADPDLLSLLRQAAGVDPRDRLLVIADDPSGSEGVLLTESLKTQGLRPTLLIVPELPHEGAEPDPVLLDALRNSRLVIFSTRVGLLHSKSVLRALEQSGARAVDMAGLGLGQALRLLDLEPARLQRDLDDLDRFFQSGSRVTLTSDAGTRFEFEMQTPGTNGRVPPTLARLPLGPCTILPRPGSGMGTIVADRVIPDLGLRTPLVLTFANGSLLDSSDPALLSLFEPGASRQFSLMTIGAHPQARPRGGPAEERLVCGRVALGIGANLFYGGSCDAAAHGQFIDSGARVEVDSRPLPDRFAPPPPEDGPSLPEGFRSSDIYRRFFENSNEALCILDFDSQILLEVNPAFESLTGYGRDEAVGRLSVSHLVSPESAEALARRRPLSLAHPSDRLEIRLVTRDKRPRSVDMSLRMMQVAGRNLVIGAIRDLTEQKRLEGAARDKIEEIIKANSRMGILKEKLEKMQELTSQLFNIREESDILQAAAEFMRDRSKLGYQNVNFYLVGPEGLALTLSTGDAGNRTIPLDSDSELVRVLYGESRAIVEEDRIVMPLKGLEQNIGVMEVFVPPKEMETLTGSPAAVRTYQNVTQTLSNILGLSLENVRLYDRLLKQSILDPLTSTYNRRYLDAKLAEEMKRASRYKRPLSVLMVDINGFKNINDTMGHRQGDVVLQEIADILARSTREVDVVARYGGDEFVIVMPETGAEGARAKAAQLSEEIARTPYSNLAEGNKSIHLSCSIGAVGYDEETALRTPEDMVRKADERMYQDKRLKRKAGSP